MTLRLFNTLTGQMDPLTPSDGEALRMYACGPTVYDYGHIGNFRTFLQVDVLRRFLKLTGIKVRHVMNITDVDDKIIRNAAAAGVSIGAYSAEFEKAFFEDLDTLGVERPEIIARATEHIPRMVELVQRLAAAGAAYQTEDGSCTSGSQPFPSTASSAKKICPGWKTARASIWTSTRKIRRGILRCGKRQNPAKLRGIRPLAAGGRDGIWNARRWPWSSG